MVTWPYGQAVKTAPSQGAIRSSILLRVTTKQAVSILRPPVLFFSSFLRRLRFGCLIIQIGKSLHLFLEVLHPLFQFSLRLHHLGKIRIPRHTGSCSGVTGSFSRDGLLLFGHYCRSLRFRRFFSLRSASRPHPILRRNIGTYRSNRSGRSRTDRRLLKISIHHDRLSLIRWGFHLMFRILAPFNLINQRNDRNKVHRNILKSLIFFLKMSITKISQKQ